MQGENPLSIVISSTLEKLIGSRGSQNMKLTGSERLRESLQPNMVVTGTVTADLGQGRYNVKFMKESAVIESKTPLSVNELLHGRVVGIGDKIELQRIFKEKAGSDYQAGKQQNWEHLIAGNNKGARAVEVLSSYRVSLSAEEQITLSALLKAKTDTEALILSSVVLRKMGMRVTSEALKILYPVLTRTLNDKFTLHNMTAHLDFEAVGDNVSNSKNISELAKHIANVLNDLPESRVQQNKDFLLSSLQDSIELNASDTGDTDSHSGRDDGRDESIFDAKRLLLNAQSDGSVSHRVSIVPFLINEKLVEVDMALFSQRHKRNQHTSNEYRKIALSLELETLGKVDVKINMAGKNARVSINSENSIVSNEMTKYMPSLKKDFDEFNIRVDELRYGVIEKDKLGNVIGSVVDHYISQDSLSRVY